MSGGFNPKVVNPYGYKAQTESGEFQTPFFFGGSQVPTSLGLPRPVYNGSKGGGFKKGSKSKTHKGDMDFTTKEGDKVFHEKGHFTHKGFKLPFTK
jgi:hypothetical protein